MNLRLRLPALLLIALAPSGWAQTSDIDGDWSGRLQAGATSLRLVLHVGATSSLDSLDQGAKGLPTVVTREGDHVIAVVTGVGRFEGDVSEDGQSLAGKWAQGGGALPLTFHRGGFEPLKRPQTPVRPYPYREVEVAYANPTNPAAHLAGTLTLPNGQGPFPAVVLITGSGKQDRDETIFEHKPFLVLADDLTRRGLAVLRVDDRGVGGSTGQTPNDTSSDYAADVAAGVAFLKSRPDIDPARIGLLGHSEGGVIAPMVAAKDPTIAFVVMWAGPAVSGADIIVEQVRQIALASGATPAMADQSASMQHAIVVADMAASDASAARTAILDVFKARNSPLPSEAEMGRLTSAWYRYFLAHDPTANLKALKAPVLALYGGKDVQVAAGQNAPAARAALSGNPKAEVLVLPGLNHLFQTAQTGAVSEYQTIEETLSTTAIAAMGDWIAKTVGLPAR